VDEATSPSQPGTRDLVHYGKFFSAARINVQASFAGILIAAHQSVCGMIIMGFKVGKELNSRRWALFANICVLFGVLHSVTLAAGQPEYNRDIRPILSEHCFACHGADSASRKADLRLDQRDAAIASGAIAAGKPGDSSLIERICASDPETIMPPPETKKPLSAAQKELLKSWIEGGAEYQAHWSFIAPHRSEPPISKQQGWAKNDIDRFVQAKLEQHGLTPAPEADARTLFRRLHLDITGLPPEPADVEKFVSDYGTGNDAALSAWIDQLLASTAWGEHRARYWLDAARYADTHGLHFDNYREMWPYRDWVIRAFNANLPFDRFSIEQIAGDMLPNPTDDQLIATGFQRCNMTTNEGGTIDEENVAVYAADRVQTLGWVYLGLTTNCCQCHDHKFDPLTMKDYYSLAAFFRNTTQPAKDGNVKDGRSSVLIVTSEQDKPRWNALPNEIATATKLRDARRDSAQTAFETWLTSATPATLAADVAPDRQADIAPLQAILSTAAKDRTPEQVAALYQHFLNKHDAEFPALASAVANLEAEREAIRQRSAVTHIQEEKPNSVPMAHVLMRGEYDKPGEEVGATTPAALHPFPDAAPRNRLGLAQWLVDPHNPLTARVTVNRFWQQVFGQGLVVTAEDFGVMGVLPSHAELLDWLAVDFVDSGWDVKRFFKQMLMSSTYRQAALTTPEKLEKDRSNAWLSRGPRFRMDAEMVRDCALATSGLLSSKMYGPGAKPYQPGKIWDMVGLPEGNTRIYVPDTGENLYRRSLYTFWKRMAPPANLEAFNAPSREVCTVRRERTNTPLQALVTLNDPQFVEAARHLAERSLKHGTDDASIMNEITQRVLSRSLTPEESTVVNATKSELLKYYQDNPEDAKSLTSVGESRSDENLNTAALAAWTMVCNEIMNLDEALNK
jgi:cytochrome c553